MTAEFIHTPLAYTAIPGPEGNIPLIYATPRNRDEEQRIEDGGQEKPLACVVLVHGKGAWARKAEDWVPLAVRLAAEGYLVVYPDVELWEYEHGAEELAEVAEWARYEFECAKVGLVSGSLGLQPALWTLSEHPATWDGLVDLWGVVTEGAAQRVLHPRRLQSIKSDVLTLIGSRDQGITTARGRWHLLQENSQGHAYMREFGGGHGLLFHGGAQAELMWQALLAGLHAGARR